LFRAQLFADFAAERLNQQPTAHANPAMYAPYGER
jgi:hypothetical protein